MSQACQNFLRQYILMLAIQSQIIKEYLVSLIRGLMVQKIKHLLQA